MATRSKGAEGGPKVIPGKGAASVAAIGGTESAGSGAAGHVTYDMVRDMIDQSEQRIENRFQALETSIDHKLSRLDQLPTTQTLWVSIGGAILGGITAVLAIISYGSDRFNGGSQYTASTFEQANKARELSEANAKQLQLLLDILNKRALGNDKPKE